MVWSSFLIRKSEQLDMPSHDGQQQFFASIARARCGPLTGKRSLCDLLLAILQKEKLEAVVTVSEPFSLRANTMRVKL